MEIKEEGSTEGGVTLRLAEYSTVRHRLTGRYCWCSVLSKHPPGPTRRAGADLCPWRSKEGRNVGEGPGGWLDSMTVQSSSSTVRYSTP